MAALLKPAVLRADVSAEYYFEERCHITELSNSPLDPDLSVARARVEPGVSTRWHRLRDTAERYYIVSGTALVEIGGELAREVNAGDMVLIPPMCAQRITNTGATDLVFLAMCTPRFTPAAYEDIESQRR